MENTKKNAENVNLAREEIVKKINALVSSKTLAGRQAHANKTVINNLRHQISTLTAQRATKEY